MTAYLATSPGGVDAAAIIAASTKGRLAAAWTPAWPAPTMTTAEEDDIFSPLGNPRSHLDSPPATSRLKSGGTAYAGKASPPLEGVSPLSPPAPCSSADSLAYKS
jgi:hypothetical protein